MWQNVSSLSHVVRKKLENLEAPCVGAAPSTVLRVKLQSLEVLGRTALNKKGGLDEVMT